MRRVFLIVGVLLGLVNAAHADITPFCFKQFLLYETYLQPKTSQAIGSAVVIFKLGEQPCFFFSGTIGKDSGTPIGDRTQS